MTLIKNNLYSLIEKNNLSINKLSEKTGISRRTLTNLVNQEAVGIQFETIETLLNYFNIDLHDFWYYEKEVMTFKIKYYQDKALDITELIAGQHLKNMFVSFSLYKHKNLIVEYRAMIVTQGYSQEVYDANYNELTTVYNLNGVSFMSTSLDNQINIFEYLNNETLEELSKKIFFKVLDTLENNNVKYIIEDVFVINLSGITIPIIFNKSNSGKYTFYFESWRKSKGGDFALSNNKIIQLKDITDN